MFSVVEDGSEEEGVSGLSRVSGEEVPSQCRVSLLVELAVTYL